jgi:hypothetical protein
MLFYTALKGQLLCAEKRVLSVESYPLAALVRLTLLIPIINIDD